MARLEGFGQGHSKSKDCDYWFMNISFPATNASCSGRSVKQEFITEKVFKMLDKSMIGKELSFDYEPGEYRPVITGVSVTNK